MFSRETIVPKCVPYSLSHIAYTACNACPMDGLSLSAADVQEGGDGPVQDAHGRAAVGGVRRPRHDGLVVREGDSRVGQPGAQFNRNFLGLSFGLNKWTEVPFCFLRHI